MKLKRVPLIIICFANVKKIIYFIIILSIISTVFSACSSTPASESTAEQTTQTTATASPTVAPTPEPTPEPTATPEPSYLSTIENMSNEELMIELYNISHDALYVGVMVNDWYLNKIDHNLFEQKCDFALPTKDSSTFEYDILPPDKTTSNYQLLASVGEKSRVVLIPFYEKNNHYINANEVTRTFYIKKEFGDSEGKSFVSKMARENHPFEYNEGACLFDMEWNYIEKVRDDFIDRFVRCYSDEEKDRIELQLPAFEGRIFSELTEDTAVIDPAGMAYYKYILDSIYDISFYGDYTNEEVLQKTWNDIACNDSLLNVEKIACLSCVYSNLNAKKPRRGDTIFSDMTIEGTTLLDYVFNLKVASFEDLTGEAYNEIFDQSLIDYAGKNNIPNN